MAQATTIGANAIGVSREPPALRLGNAVAELRKTLKGLFDSYRPELHYMRGPGPKWHEKHGNRSAA